MATLEQLMAMEKPSPKQMELQARYSNAQFAVDLGYRLAKESFYPDTKMTLISAEGAEPKYKYEDPTVDEKLASYIRCARVLKVEIEKDLNDTLKVLEVVEDGAKADAPKFS